MVDKLVKLVLRKLFWGGFRHLLSDRQYATIRYWLELDAYPNLEQPEKFTEKIQYIKLFERTALRKKLADRREVREYVAQKAGSDCLIPLIGTYEHLTRDIWETLPSMFVLKANHGCGMIRIIRNKSDYSYDAIHAETEKWKQTDYAEIGREWVYRGLPRTILVEKLLLDEDQSIPKDYKFFCFHGRVELIQVDFDRYGNQKRNIYNRDFNRINCKLLYPGYEGEFEKPGNLKQAIQLAENLSAGLNFIRVDLYLLKNKVYFGEMTNYPGNGFAAFEPEEMEYKMGSLLRLNSL